MSDDALKAAQAKAAHIEPEAAAFAIGASFLAGDNGDSSRGTLDVPFLGSSVSLTYPALELAPDAEALPSHVVALLVYHLGISDGSEPTGEWVSFGDLPSGAFYVNAFRGYTGTAVARRFGDEPEVLASRLEALGAEPIEGFADKAWTIRALPKVPVMVLWWDADDEFQARADLLFDSDVLHHLPLDGCAVLGSWLTARLMSEG